MKKKLISASFILFFGAISGIVLFADTAKDARISAKSGLRLRDRPALTGKKIALIPYNSEVLVLEEKNNKVVLNGRKGQWTRIQWGKKTGWVFGGFLSRPQSGETNGIANSARTFSRITKIQASPLPYTINSKTYSAMKGLESFSSLSKKEIQFLGIGKIAAGAGSSKIIPLTRLQIDKNIFTLVLVNYCREESSAYLINFSKKGDYLDSLLVFYGNTEGFAWTESTISADRSIAVSSGSIYENNGKSQTKRYMIDDNGRFVKKQSYSLL